MLHYPYPYYIIDFTLRYYMRTSIFSTTISTYVLYYAKKQLNPCALLRKEPFKRRRGQCLVPIGENVVDQVEVTVGVNTER